MNPTINQNIAQKLKQTFQDLKNPVKLIVFTQDFECLYCHQNRNLIQEVVKTSSLLSIEVYDFIADQDKVKQHGIEMIPATALKCETNSNIKFYGIPSGYEFSSLIETIKMVGTGDSGLQDNTKFLLKRIRKPMNIKVFTTLTCPYCPPAVITAHRFAFENKFIESCMVESSQFIPLSNKFRVYAVPKIVINDKYEFEGSLPEEKFLDEVMKAYSQT